MNNFKRKPQIIDPMTWDDDEPKRVYPAICPVCEGKRKVETTRLDDETGKLIVVKDHCPNCGGSGVI